MNFPIWVLFLFSILIADHHPISIAQNDLWGYNCGSLGNYSRNEVYKRNLDDVLYNLTGSNNGFGFFNSTFGQANAVALCRGDIKPGACLRCVDDAARQLRQVCPEQIEAGGWYDTCFLRYSNRSTGIETGISVYSWNSRNVSDSSYEQWNQTVLVLLVRLRQEAAGGDQLRKYASGNMTAPGLSTIYGMMQCTPDLSAKECDDCLAQATAEIRESGNGRRLGGRAYYTPSCVIRYENDSFFNSTWYPDPTGDMKTPNDIVPILIGSISVGLSTMFLVSLFFVIRRCEKETQKGPLHPQSNIDFIQVATNNFSIENKLGEGGFGSVYWVIDNFPTLRSFFLFSLNLFSFCKISIFFTGEIAVKRLSRNSTQGVREFKTEVLLIIRLQHKNLVRLLGYRVQGTERLLIYEFMANSSLDTFLFDPDKRKELDWAKRANIVTGIAKGLRYLHEDSRLKIIHRDMKAGNILLDDEMNPKISDFGTARIFKCKQLEANTNRIVGTYGYMAPEYAMEGLFSIKSDVYSFGVLLLEIISGQRNNRFCYQDQPKNFLSTAYQLWRENKGEELIDHGLIQNSAVNTDAIRWINIALLCVQEDPQDRPKMSTVVFMLEGQWSTDLPTPSEPPASFARFAALSEETSTNSDADASAHPTIKIDPTSSTTMYFSLANQEARMEGVKPSKPLIRTLLWKWCATPMGELSGRKEMR
ncbi:hypothetical protein OSB04_002106 [Centaurea solstitialis]|uniref:Uncharacterized protein n=1 Tax=Centaurea solstitialis TaxID=347529 RepID=A0AA38U406_9ASTR|nr:hypothetical protein OSB04_002106 [Centaurea solstitialis]